MCFPRSNEVDKEFMFDVHDGAAATLVRSLLVAFGRSTMMYGTVLGWRGGSAHENQITRNWFCTKSNHVKTCTS